MSSLLVLMLVAAVPESERRPTHVTYEAPTTCPGADYFHRALAFRTEKIQLMLESSAATAQLSLKVTQAAKKFSGRLEVHTSGGTSTTRQLSGPRCESVVAALSLVAALLLDPEAKTGALPKALPAVEVAPAPPPPAPEPVAPPPPAPVVIEAPPVIVEKPTPTIAPTPRVQFALLVGGHLTTAYSGSADFGGGLSLDLTWQRLAARLSAAGGSGRSVTSVAGTAMYALHALAELAVGARFDLGGLQPEVGGLLQVSLLPVRGVGADEIIESFRMLACIGPYARLGLKLEEWRVAVQVAGAVNLNQEHYRIEPNGQVFAVPVFAGLVGLQVGHALP